MKKILILIFLCLFTSFSFAKTQREEYRNDYLYSAEYFDYLIECAQQDSKETIDTKNKVDKENEIIIFDEDEIDISEDQYIPLKLKIEQNNNISPYKDSYKKIDSKTTIPLFDKFSIIHDNIKSRNKYNSNDYKIITGAEFQPFRLIKFSSGLETNYRGLDQNPTSRKIYFNPSFSYKNKIALTFYNKMNILDYSSDHDIAIKISPFKTKILDFGFYSGITHKRSGSISESINFSTNFYF